VGRRPIVGEIIDAAKGNGRPVITALSGMVIRNVEYDFEACVVDCAHGVPKLEVGVAICIARHRIVLYPQRLRSP
jgi:hypothetical protein